MAGSILFLDLATRYGFCDGEPGKRPFFGAARFAPEGANSSAVFGGCFKWVAERCQVAKPKTIVYEAPLDPRHMGPKTSRDVGLRLIGLPAVVEAAAYLCGVWDVREARADDIRLFLINKRPRADEAKRLVMAKLQAMGYEVNDPDAADALAGWLYACHIIAPNVARDTTPLFGEHRTGQAPADGGF